MSSKSYPLPSAPGQQFDVVVAIRLPKQIWIPAVCNVCSASELFELNIPLRRLECLLLGRSPSSGWFLRHSIDRQVDIDFQELRDPQFVAAEGIPHSLLHLTDAHEIMLGLRAHLEVEQPLHAFQLFDNEVVIVSESSRSVKQEICGHYFFYGHRVKKNNKPSVSLGKAIERCDLQGIRKAVASGASLKDLPESSLSPLEVAMFKCETPEGAKCVELLIQLGCSIDGLILNCFHNWVDNDLATRMLKMLIKHKADVNQINKHQGPPLLEAVLQGNLSAVKLLMKHGANPELANSNGLSALGWLEREFATELSRSRQKELAALLTLVKGEAVEIPKVQPLRPDLEAENIRFANMLRKAPSAKASRMDKDAILIDGRPARFERLKVYLDFSSWDDEQYSSETLANTMLADLAVDGKDLQSTRRAVQSAMYLRTMKHFEFAGCKLPEEFDSVAMRWVSSLATAVKRSRDHYDGISNIKTLGFALLLAQMARDWDCVQHVASAFSDRMIVPLRYPDPFLPIAIGQWLVGISNDLRARKSSRIAAMAESVKQSRNSRAKHLLHAWESLFKEDSPSYQASISKSLSLGGKPMTRLGANFLFDRIAIWESIVVNQAIRQGLVHTFSGFESDLVMVG